MEVDPQNKALFTLLIRESTMDLTILILVIVMLSIGIAMRYLFPPD